MPRATYGPKVEARTLRLLEALLLYVDAYVHGELEDCKKLDIEPRWQENGDRPKLIIKTKLRTLEALTRKDGKKGSLTTTQISESLHRMEDFLEILEDNRVQKKGLEEWRFTLTLWSKNINKNLEIFNQKWEQRRPAKGKQQNAEHANTSKTVEKPCGKIRSAVPLIPSYFVDRPQIKSDVKELLLEEVTTSGMLAIGAIQGLGGIGKTTLASHLIRDVEVQRRFPDGILWATLGQTPDLLPLLSQWVRDLGDHDFKPTTVQMTSIHLRRLLVDKTVLLVVDDVWEEDHLEPFLVGNDNCRVLVTTRRLHVAEARGARLYQLGLMSPEQSLELFSNRLNRSLEGEEKEQAQAMAEAVGYLPLALELAVARISRGVAWTDLCAELKKEVARLELLEDPRQRRRNDLTLMASFNLSLEALRIEDETLWQRFVWLGVLPEDATIAAPMTSTLWQAELLEADEDLELLYSDALLLSDSPVIVREKEWRAYRLHDLVHDIARKLLTTQCPPDPPTLGGMRVESPSNLLPEGMRVESPPATPNFQSPPELGDLEGKGRKGSGGITGLGLTLPEAHGLLLERYLSKTPHQLWHELPDDGYIHARLTWHIEKAEKTELLHQLLQEETPEGRNGWYEACERLGKTGNFVEDVGRAWQWAEKIYERDSTQSISLQCRYALIFATLNNLASNIPPELLAALVKTGYWQPTQGLAYVQQMQDSRERANALAKVVPYLPDTLLSVALEVTRSIQDEHYRAEALSSLADKFPQVLPEALELTRSIKDEYDRAEALISLANQLPQVLPEALELTRSLQDESKRAIALIYLATQFPQEVLPEALELTRSLQSELERAWVLLTNLADKLPQELLPQALEVTRSLQDEYQRARTLICLANKFPEVLPEALEVTRSLQDEYRRAIALRKLSNKLPELLPQALEVTRSIQDELHRARALSDLVDQLPELLPEALEMTRSFQSELERAWPLRKLAEKLPQHLLPEVLEMTRSFQSEYQRSKALSFLLPRLSLTHWNEEFWEENLHILARRQRQELMKNLANLSSVIEALGGQEALRGLAIAMRDVSRQWP